uniref:Uncharacterized protein n=1 Tax=Sphaerodactylus townsendi TaxID=933632 RepID=A0ACB8FZ30_9SAUR
MGAGVRIRRLRPDPSTHLLEPRIQLQREEMPKVLPRAFGISGMPPGLQSLLFPATEKHLRQLENSRAASCLQRSGKTFPAAEQGRLSGRQPSGQPVLQPVQ